MLDRHEFFSFCHHLQKDKQRKQRHSLKLGKKRRESSKRNYYIFSPRVIIKAIIINNAALAANAVPAAPVTSAAAFAKRPSVGGSGAMMHDCVKWIFTGQQALKQTQEWQTVLELALPKRQGVHYDHSCSFSKFITTEAIQKGVIALTTTQTSLDSMR